MAMTKTWAGAALGAAALLSGCGQQDSATAAAPQAAVAVDGNMESPSVSLAPLDTALDSIPEAGNCSLDTINGQPVAAAVPGLRLGQAVTFVGWAGDADGQVPGTARLVLSGAAGTYAADATMGGRRPDVAKALGQPALIKSGLTVSTTLPNTPGNYSVSVVMGNPSDGRCLFDVNIPLGGS